MAKEKEFPNSRELNEGTRREGTSLEVLKDMKKKVLRKGKSFHRGPAGQHGGGLVNRGLWEKYEGRLWKTSVSLWELCEGTWSERFLLGQPEGSRNGHISL